jgi:hypothetical protein
MEESDYKSFYNEAECYDMEEIIYTHTKYVEKRYLFGLIRLRRPIREIVARFNPRENEEI